jgi:tight adherence protein C
VLAVIFGASAIGAAALILWWALSGSRSSPTATRNLTSGLGTNDLREAVLARSATERAVAPAVSHLARQARRLTPAGRIENLERRLVLAGVSGGWTIERVLAAKVALGAAGALIGALRVVRSPGTGTLVLTAVLAVLLFLAPDVFLVNRAQKREQAIRRALPDALDQLTITVEAGLAFEAAVARSRDTTSGPLSDELARTMQDVQAGMSRREALRALADRAALPELRSFVNAVLQADRYGVPIAQVLRVQSAELRLKRSQRAEEQAMKLPVKLLFPTVMFIFPVLFIVLLGPAALQIGRAF